MKDMKTAGDGARQIKKVANATCVGAGVIGAGWATAFVMGGYPVVVYDIAEQGLETAKGIVRKNLASLVEKEIYTQEQAEQFQSRISYTTDMAEALKEADFIQESGPESYELKAKILKQIENCAPADAIIASSTSGLLITEIAKSAKHPERCVGGHPYNPPHLMPLVEITKGEKSSDEAVDAAYAFYKNAGKEPVVLQKESIGFIANRLQLALYREAIDLVVRGVCSVEDVDKATLYGLGLRYGAMGPNLIYHLGAGDKGIRGLLTALHDSSAYRLKDMARWTDEPEVWPELAEEGVLAEIENRNPQHGKNIPEIMEFRDNVLIELLKIHGKL